MWVQRYAPEISKRIRPHLKMKSKIIDLYEGDGVAAQCVRSFHTAERTLEGSESLPMMRKGQVKRLDGKDLTGQAKFVERHFDVAA